MLPNKSKSKSNSSDKSLRTGTLILFDHEDSVKLGVIQGFLSLKARILAETGNTHELTFSRLTVLPESLPADLHTNDEIVSYLLELRNKHEEAAKELDLKELWEKCDKDTVYNLSELTLLFFDKESLENNLSLRYRLQSYPLYFKRRRSDFVARSQSEIEDYRSKLEVKQKKEKLLHEAFESINKTLKDPNLPLTREARKLITSVFYVAAGTPNMSAEEKKEVRKTLDLVSEQNNFSLGGSREERAVKLLQKLNLIQKNTNLLIYKHRVPVEFSDELIEEADKLSPEALSPKEALDLTHLPAITIDDASTSDMDDAFTLEHKSGGYTLGVHISDVASAIGIGSALDLEAKARATSIYSTDVISNMLPEALSEDKLSLIQGEVRYTLSCIFDVRSDFTIESCTVTPAKIKVSERLSYDDVDEALNSGTGDLAMLFNIAMNSEAERLAEGGVKIPKREKEVVLTDPDNPLTSDFELVELDEAGPARSLVGEMMILSNFELAKYASKNNVPYIYRSQEPSESKNEKQLAALGGGPAYDYALRSGLKRSIASTKPGSHATLGLSVYAQATSPIRRYLDLCNQRQLLAHVTGQELPYTAEELEKQILDTQQPLATARLYTRDIKRCWLLRYLHRKYKKSEIKATVLRDDMKNYLIELEEVYLPVLLKSERKLKAGNVILVSFKEIDPRHDILKLSLSKILE